VRRCRARQLRPTGLLPPRSQVQPMSHPLWLVQQSSGTSRGAPRVVRYALLVIQERAVKSSAHTELRHEECLKLAWRLAGDFLEARRMQGLTAVRPLRAGICRVKSHELPIRVVLRTAITAPVWRGGKGAR
jgi:hypothetical protein